MQIDQTGKSNLLGIYILFSKCETGFLVRYQSRVGYFNNWTFMTFPSLARHGNNAATINYKGLTFFNNQLNGNSGFNPLVSASSPLRSSFVSGLKLAAILKAMS